MSCTRRSEGITCECEATRAGGKLGAAGPTDPQGTAGEVPEAMETRPLKLEEHSLSRTNSDVRVESGLHTSRTINEPIKPSFI